MAPCNGKTTPFSLTRENVVLVKPSEPTPSEILSLSSIDNDPHLEIICQTIYVYRPKFVGPQMDSPGLTFITKSPVSINGNSNHCTRSGEASPDPAIALKQGLSRALVYYYPLAGKLRRRADGALQITCDADGVPFAEATADCSLDSLNYLDGIDAAIAQPFVFDSPSDHGEQGYHPLVIQVTKFSCGGFTVGMGLSHSVCDGYGAAQFFRAVAELAGGKNEPSVKPVWQRDRLVGIPSQDENLNFQLLDTAALAKSPFIPAAQLCHGCFDVDADSIRRLKGSTADEAGGEEHFTTIEILGAYVWRSRLRALKQSRDGKTVLHLGLSIRKLMSPPLPDGYYGNAFVPAHVVVSGQELDKGPLYEVARLIKRSKKAASEADSITRSIKFSEAFRQRKMRIDDSGAAMVLTDWRQLKLLEEVDFGGRELVNMMPIPWRRVEFVSLCIFLPANRVNAAVEGGVRVLVYLPAAAMSVFEQEMDALRTVTANKI